MSEELKVLIRVQTEEARKKVKQVKDEIAKIKEQSEQTDAAVKETMGGIVKGATAALATITALIAGMVSLGKAALENQKQINKVITTFQNLGSSAAQAQKTYVSLYRFLGDGATATEAANLLAQITTNEQELAQWTEILKGVYATFPDSLPVEALAEATNESIKTAKVTGNLADAINWLGGSEDAVNEAMASMNSEADRELYLRGLLNSMYGNAAALYEQNNAEVLAHNESQAKLNSTMARLAKYLTPAMTALNNVATILLTYLTPAIETVSAAIVVFCEWIGAAVGWLATLFGIEMNLGTMAEDANGVAAGFDSASSAVNGVSKGLSNGVKAAKELRKLTMGFDELNVVSNPATDSAGGALGGAITMPQIDTSFTAGLSTSLDNFKQTVAEVREQIEGILVLVGLVGLGIAAWKLLDAYTAGVNLLGVLTSIAGYAMIIGGAIMTIVAYSDAWANGIDWENLSLMLAGIALTVGGLVIKFGTFGGAIGTVVAGVSLLVLGIKDIIDNGYSMEAVITITIGVLLTLVGVVWAFNAALLANPITWIIAAIVALVAAFVILWNECDWFRNFWIGLWDGICAAFDATVAWLDQACKDIANFFVGAWEGIKRAWNGVGDWFKGLWQGIKDTFSAVGQFFGDVFSAAWSAIKGVFTAGGKVFDGIKDGIVTVFKTVVNGLIDGINAVVKLPFEGLNGILNTIHGISIAGIKPFSWLTWRAPVPQLPHLAKGGITTGSTIAEIGEAGKEAVLPLERNTEWIDMLADRLASRTNTPSKIVLMMDSRELGWANIESINSITQQTGTLQLRLV